GELAAQNPVSVDEKRRVWIADTDVTASIRKSDIDRLVPVVARHPEVRTVMRARQRELADDGNVVIEGRDIGTVVAPQAEVKVYLNAERGIRAQRRLAERPEIGADALATDLRLRDESDAARMQPAEDGNVVIEGRDIGTVVAPQAEVKVYLNAERDIRAQRRLAERPEIGADALATDLRLRDESDAARMRPAEDAIQIDTTELDVEDVVAQIEDLVRARQPA
ncbi:MAG TPA: (d)CMP kinase, partial [Gaiellaceae bacterium]|nr:(d)CMP kinase [Gaiellaceae bacterium]